MWPSNLSIALALVCVITSIKDQTINAFLQPSLTSRRAHNSLVNISPPTTTTSIIHPNTRTISTIQPLHAGTTSSIIPNYSELMERIPSKKVISAIEQSNGQPIVASDLATKAGISLSQARKDLTTLASLTRGDIAVSKDGELLYTFPTNINAVLSSNSAKYRAVVTWKEKIFPPLFYATKVGFGLALVASLVAIYSTIFFVSSSSSDRDDRDDRRRGGGMPMGMGGFWGPSPFDFFYYRPYYSRYYYSPAYGNTDQRGRDPDEMGFLESVFSYVFGDGDPNGDVEERRVSLVAEMIRMNGGAVTAEQLAPFCDDAPLPLTSGGRLGEERAYVDESFVLPIVTQLDGEPQVTEEGDIVYTFPELMTSAASSKSMSSFSSGEMDRMRRESKILRKAGLEEDVPTSMIKRLLNMNGISTRGSLDRADLINQLEEALPGDRPGTDYMDQDVDDPTLLLEREYKFSLASQLQTILAGGLGVVNLGGALYLGNLLSQYALYGVRLPSYFGIIQQFFPLLLGYAVLFNVIPLVRNFWIQRENSKIKQRNEARKSWKSVLEQKAGSVKRKLAAAARFSKRMRQLGAGGSRDIVFDTSKDLFEMDKVKEKTAMDDFDKMLNKKGTNSDVKQLEKAKDRVKVKDSEFEKVDKKEPSAWE